MSVSKTVSPVALSDQYSLPNLSNLHPNRLRILYTEILDECTAFFREHPGLVAEPANQARREAGQTVAALRAAARHGMQAFTTTEEWERVRPLYFPVGDVQNDSFEKYLWDLLDSVSTLLYPCTLLLTWLKASALANLHDAGVAVFWCRPEHSEAADSKVNSGNYGSWASEGIRLDGRTTQAFNWMDTIFNDNIAIAFVDRLTRLWRGGAWSTLQEIIHLERELSTTLDRLGSVSLIVSVSSVRVLSYLH
jgi:hypothetical protein